MKKLFALSICFLLLTGCFSGCGSADDTATTGSDTTGTEATAAPESLEDLIAGVFSVGYSKVDITPIVPNETVRLAGFSSSEERTATSVLDPIYATCVAFTDEEGTTVLMFGLDMLNTAEKAAEDIRDKITAEIDIPRDNILFSATHTHSSMSPKTTGTPGERFRNGCLQAAKEALADRKPAQMYASFGRLEGMNWRRHFILTDGSYRAYEMGLIDQSLIYGHLGQADNLMQLVKFTREGGKDVVLVNWQAHYAGANKIDHYAISADYPSVLRNELEKQLDCHAAFVLGGAGNVVCGSRMTNTYIFDNYDYETYITHGQLLAAEAVKIAENFQPAETGNIHLTKENYVMQTKEHPLYTFGFGEFGCAFAPFEIFDMHAREVREASPYRYTFYASCANAGDGQKYMPHEESFSYYCYEADLGSNLYGKGAAEILRDQLISMMDKTFQSSGQPSQEKAEGYMSTPYEPRTNGHTYLNPAPGALPITEGENGYWCMDLLYNGKIARILTRDKALADTIAAMDTVQLYFDDYNVAVGIVE